ncbi:MAG: T9SS type A sorting domain-containing protein [Sphingomonadales bacterium]|nr:T9SS type A sorting domain-containing protein [Sphingomonadales bacterium]
MKKGLLFILTILSVNVFAQAFESFNFTGLASANGWTVHSGTTGPITALTTPSAAGNSLSFSGLEASSGNRVSISGSVTEDINKPIVVTGTSIYFSFLMNVTDLSNMNASGSYFIHLGANNSANAFQIFIPRLHIALGTNPNQFKLGILNTTGGTSAQPTFIAQEFNPNTTYFVVVKASAANVGDPITASLWVNPIPGAAEPAASVISTGGTSGWPTNPPIAICLRQSTGIGTMEIDEIRVGTTWAAVTPTAAASCVSYNTITASACNTYSLNNQTYTTSGTYVQTLANANAAGCDSIINLNLTINNANASTLNITNCGAYTLNNQTYSASGTYTQLTQNVAGCDSTITLNLTIVGSLTYYQDLDNDGFGNAAVSQTGCAAIPGYVTNSSDCNDNNNAIYPGAVDIAGNGIDEDCNGFDAPLQLGIYEFAGTLDCATQDVAATNTSSNWTFSDFTAQGTSCASGGGIFNRSGWNQSAAFDAGQYNQFTITGANCTNLNLSKLALNHRTSSTGGTPTIFVRSSLDNYTANIDTIASSWNGNVMLSDTVLLPAAFANVAAVTFRFYVINQATATSTLRMDNVSVWGNAISITPTLYYADTDGDGFGDAANDTLVCNAPVGYVSNNTDCNDSNAAVNPNTIWYQDLDNDQVGNTAVTLVACLQPAGYVLASGDCDDNNASITAPVMYYVDADNDGFGDDATGTPFCQVPVNLIPIGGDCDDNNNAIYPGAPEICDGFDNNCNGQNDEGLTFVNYYFDFDGDGFGIGNPTVACTPVAGYATQNGDCDDSNNAVYPGATDTEGNGIDENCDGVDGVLGFENNSLFAQIAPNPTQSMVNVQLSQSINGQVTITDINGKVLLQEKAMGLSFEFDLSAFEQGTYLIHFTDTNHFLVQRISKL